jgi:hypothetical protein
MVFLGTKANIPHIAFFHLYRSYNSWFRAKGFHCNADTNLQCSRLISPDHQQTAPMFTENERGQVHNSNIILIAHTVVF